MTTLNVGFVTETCCHKGCNLTFAFTTEFYNRVRNDRSFWYCPAGHSQHYTGTSDEEKLRQAAARETALKDQLTAAIRDAEQARVHLLRDRQRYANGVCPCCNRFFPAVMRHMKSEHPEYDAAAVRGKPSFKCGCGRAFESFLGLRQHQGKQRGERWDEPKAPFWRAHLTVV